MNFKLKNMTEVMESNKKYFEERLAKTLLDTGILDNKVRRFENDFSAVQKLMEDVNK